MIVFHSRDGSTSQANQYKITPITKRASRENNLEEDPRDADGDNAQVKNCERDAQGERL